MNADIRKYETECELMSRLDRALEGKDLLHVRYSLCYTTGSGQLPMQFWPECRLARSFCGCSMVDQ
jgi:hypothetical protein